jgi:prepilin-type processing-associated H-X9-DG protein
MFPRRGFTLTELLVIAVFTAILAAILSPTFSSARERGRIRSCIANQRHLAELLLLYAEDHGGMLPTDAEVWKVLDLAPYSLICPSAGLHTSNAYVYNYTVSGKSTSAFVNPSVEILTADGQHQPTDGSETHPNVAYSAADFNYIRHQERMVASFLDGHVTTVSSDVTPGAPVLWLKADAITGVSDGAPIDTWRDSSPQGLDLSAEGYARPIYRAHDLAGKPALYFSGDQVLSRTSSPILAGVPRTVCLVAQADSGSHGGWLCGFRASETICALSFLELAKTVYLYSDGYTRTNDAKTDRLAISDLTSSPFVATFRLAGEGKRVEVFVNGKALDIAQKGHMSREQGEDAFSLGGLISDPTNAWEGYIAEVLLYDAALTPTTRRDVERYLMKKWGVRP